MARLRGMPLMRYESSGALDANTSNDILNIRYDGQTTTDDLAAGSRATTSNSEALTTNKPVVIYSYEATCIWGGPAGALWQYYGDYDDISSLNVWDMSNTEFIEGMRNKIFMGSTPSFDSGGGAQPQFKVYKLKFKAKKNPRKLRAKFGKWAVKPIVLGPHTKDCMGWSLTNLRSGAESTSFINQRYYAMVEIKSWQTEF